MMSKPVKVRLSTNATGSGVNAASYVPSFRYPSLHDALSIIQPGDFIAIGDIKQYYMAFPFATEAYYNFGVEIANKVYYYATLFFGYGPGAYFASFWSAEIRQWVLAEGVQSAHVMDDWLTRGTTSARATADMAVVRSKVVQGGWEWQDGKDICGQQVVYLGVLIDSVTMTLRFDQDVCALMSAELTEWVTLLSRGGDMEKQEIVRVCGKLGWLGSPLQSAPIRTWAWWRYAIHGKALFPAVRRQLLRDSQWWITHLNQ